MHIKGGAAVFRPFRGKTQGEGAAPRQWARNRMGRQLLGNGYTARGGGFFELEGQKARRHRYNRGGYNYGGDGWGRGFDSYKKYANNDLYKEEPPNFDSNGPHRKITPQVTS